MTLISSHRHAVSALLASALSLGLTACVTPGGSASSASAPGAAAQPDDAALAQAVAQATQTAKPVYRAARTDLNGDGQDDAVVLLEGPEWCGTGGCTLLVLRGDAKGFGLLSRSTVSRNPVRVLGSSQQGWRDLMVNTQGVGDVVLGFDGKAYASNPSLLKPADLAQVQRARTLLP